MLSLDRDMSRKGGNFVKFVVLAIFAIFVAQSFNIPYYRKLTLHEIKVLEINAT